MQNSTSLSDLCELIVDCPHSTPIWTEEGIVVLRNNKIRNGRLKIQRGEQRPEDFDPMVARIWQQWNILGQPGGELHPELLEVARLARRGESGCR
jgi:hypothetical protein